MNLLIMQADASSRYSFSDYKTVAVLSNDGPKSCPFFDDVRIERLEDFYDTYEFSTPSNYEEAQHITPGNYVIFEDETSKYRLFRIIDVEDSINYGIHIKKAFCENAFVNDLLKTLVPKTSIGTVNFRDAFAHCLSNSGWQIESAEWLGELRDQSFDGMTTAQTAIQEICKDYRGEIDAYVILNDANKIIRKCFDLVEKRGRGDTGKRFEYRRDLIGATRKKTDAELYTAIRAFGKDGLTFRSLNNGKDTIYDEAANDLYNGGREFLVKYVDFSDEEFPSSLYVKAREELQNCNHPKYEYTIETALLEQYAGYTDEQPVWLGDYVRVVDFEMIPEMTVSARIIEKQTSFSDKSKNAVVLGEYVELVNTTPDEIKSLQSKLTNLQNSLSPVYRIEIRASAGTVARNGFLQTTGDAVLEAIVYKNNVRVTGKDDQYVWEKTFRKTGERDYEWEQQNSRKGSKITVTGEDYAKNCDFYCHFLDDSYNFVATSYFKTEVETVVKEIEKLKDTHAIVPIITDTHYATDAFKYPEEKQRAIEHMLNVIEVTHQSDCDCVVHIGDMIDGITSKALALSNLQAVAATFKNADAPVMFTKGNHDDNMIGDNRQYGQLGTNTIRPHEMSPILKENYLRKNIQYNAEDDAIYSYYDVEDKKLRLIVLDSFDIRYDLLQSNKKLKYQTRTHGGYQQKQVQWLADTLLDTPSNYGVVVFTHIAIGGVLNSSSWDVINETAIVGILNAWKNGTTYRTSSMSSTEKNSDFAINVTANFTSRGKGKLMAIFAGHTHQDIVRARGFGSTPTIIISSSYSMGETSKVEYRITGTTEEDLFDVAAINVDANEIKLIRFGYKVNGQRIRTIAGGGND